MSMKKAVIYGAGNIGRGFIGAVLSQAGYHVVFADVNEVVVNKINEDGKYTVQIAHTDSFSGVIAGLDYVYYEVGQTVKHNVPIGYSKGESEVQVTMYADGNLLNCFAVSEDNSLAWVSEVK